MLTMAFGSLTLSALVAALMGALGFAVGKRKADGLDYYTEHVEGRVRHPVRYALTHPVEAAKRAVRDARV